ncbi:MAG: hypothetical protein ILNGONEN_01110 [Syntrophorhabdaceae bacterium]|nr:hypothetical protein [Syntrophorhabdaceae bacterium]
MGNLYGVINDWSVVVDQQGIIRYKQPGVNISAINTVIDNLLATTAVDEQPATVRGFELKQNFPNPFAGAAGSRPAGNSTTSIAFTLPRAQRVSLKIYDNQGRLVHTLLDAPIAAGRHAVVWNGLTQQNEAAAAGVYFYVLHSSPFREMKKMLLIR